MMFRKPMRLEKWVAFDGALGVEVVEAARDAHSDEDADAGAGMFLSDTDAPETSSGENADGGIAPASESAFSFFSDTLFSPLMVSTDNTVNVAAGSGTIYLTIPIVDLPTGAAGLPFWGTSLSASYSGVNAPDVFFEIGNTTGGTFDFYSVSNADNSFIASHGLQPGDWFAFRGAPDGSGNFSISLKQVAIDSAGNLHFDDTAVIAKGRITANGLRFFVVDPNNASGTSINGDANQQIAVMLQSLLFTPGGSSSTNTSPGLSVFYQNTGGNAWNDNWFGDGAGSAFVPGNNKGGIDDVTQECDANGNVVDPGDTGDPGGDDDDDPDNPVDPVDPADPDDPVDPVIPDPVLPTDPVVPSDPGSSDSSGESGDDASTGEGGGTDAEGGDGQGRDNLMAYIYRREDSSDDDGSGGDGGGGDDQSEAVLVAAVLEDPDTESAAAAAALELAREVEELLRAVKAEKLELEAAVGRLREEYLLLGASERESLKAILRDKFALGNREMAAVNRVIDQMNRQIAEFRLLSAERRDGMLIGNLQDLVDSAARRTGETAALAKALNLVAGRINISRAAAEPLPDVTALTQAFDATYASAMRDWLQKAGLSDPMGKELARHTLGR